MKLLISLLTAISTGCLVQTLWEWQTSYTFPSRDFLTRALRKQMVTLQAQKIPWLRRYLEHLDPLLKEVPLPTDLDRTSFLALHMAAGLPLWLMMTVAFPSAALWTFFPCLSIGAMTPYIWLKHKQGQFHTALLKALPDYLELQALVMEAGLDFNAGLQHYLDKGTTSPLQTLLRETQREMQMGRARLDAFSVLAKKTRFAPLREMCRALVQAFSLGASLAPLLREQAATLRVKRMQIAEKKAAEAPLKVLFPLFVFIFPTIFIVLLGPMVLMFARGGF